jgi:peptidoglycan/xylan/chitin deacetylase (PgdA/CDA1 family)
MISVCFRFDDPSATSDHELERRIIDLFQEYQVPLCVAAIPYQQTADGEIEALSPQHAGHLIDAQHSGNIDIALHGHTHIHRSGDGTATKSEFASLPLVQQSQLIEQGLTHLKTIFPEAINGFVPPWNSYDRNTARAVAQAGMRYLSASWEMFSYGELAIVPRTCTLRNARQAIAAALTIAEFDPVVVVVFHPDEFEEYRDLPRDGEPPSFTSLPALASLLGWVRNNTPADVSSIREVAINLGKGRPLWTPHDLPLPYRVKSVVPRNMLLRSPKISTVSRMIARNFKP